MSSTTNTARTKDQLTAVFPAAPHAINGKINLNELIRVWQHVKACAQRTQTDYDQQNYLYLVLPPELWGYFSSRAYPQLPGDPGANPLYDTSAGTAENATIRDTWQLNQKYYTEDKNMNAALVDRFLSLIPMSYNNSYEKAELTSNPNKRFLEVLHYFWSEYGFASEEDVAANTNNLTMPWQPHEGIEKLIDRFESAVLYGHFAKKSTYQRNSHQPLPHRRQEVW